MKKRNVINLIRFYSEKNDIAFRNEAEIIAKDFDREGDSEIAGYIMSMLSNTNVFVPQNDENMFSLLEKTDVNCESMWLPDAISKDLMGIINVISNHKGINKFLFQGRPGTGKTEAVKQIARVLHRDLLTANFSMVVDSKLGNTSKNIAELFDELHKFPQPQKLIILFDEIDAIALDRTNQQDHREMGRATSSLLKELDHLKSDIILIATTNLYKHFDKAIIRRFDAVIDFDRYSERDLVEISESYLDKYLKEFHMSSKNVRMLRKIISIKKEQYSPGEIKNMIRTSIAFSNPQIEGDYLNRLYEFFCQEEPTDIIKLKRQGFTVREIGLLTGLSKSSVDRLIREGR